MNTSGVIAVACVILAGWVVVAVILGAESLRGLSQQADLDEAAADAEALSVCTDPECLLHTDAGASLADVLLWPDGEPLP